MKKIPTIFKRNPEKMNELLNEPHPDCSWVLAGEGVATRKYDGACCCVIDGELLKRREVKKGKKIPQDFTQEDFDSITGKTFGWVPVFKDKKEDKYFVEGFNNSSPPLPDGTYELVGPKVQGNPERFNEHYLLKHSLMMECPDCPTDYDGLKQWLSKCNFEGIVWHHPDGRMAKIKKRDFGLSR